MEESQPLITVAVPTYNRADCLKCAIESALCQTYRNIELIVADNCSNDDTESVVKGFKDSRIRYYKHSKNGGMVFNWNFCLEQAKGELFLLLSDDDILEKDAVEWLQSRFKNPSVTLAYGRVLCINQDSKPIKLSRTAPAVESGHEFVINSFRCRRGVVPVALMHRTGAAKELGGYPDIGTASDMALRLLLAGDSVVEFSTRTLAKYRIHEQALSRALEKVVHSHDLLLELVNKEGSPLYKYRQQAYDYCNRFIFRAAIAEFLRGNKDSFLIAVTALKRLNSNPVYISVLYLLGLLPAKVLKLWAFRKKVEVGTAVRGLRKKAHRI